MNDPRPLAERNGMSHAEHATWLFLADKKPGDDPYTYVIKQSDLTAFIQQFSDPRSNAAHRPERTQRPMVAGEPAADRLLKYTHLQYRYGLKASGGGVVNPLQVALVLHALADHTAIMQALQHRPDPHSPWPEATSIGRWYHDVADDIENNHDTIKLGPM